MTITVTAYKKNQKVTFAFVPRDGYTHLSTCSMESVLLCRELEAKGWETFKNGWKFNVGEDEVIAETEAMTGDYKEITQTKAEALIPEHIRNAKARQPLTRAEKKAFGLL